MRCSLIQSFTTKNGFTFKVHVNLPKVTIGIIRQPLILFFLLLALGAGKAEAQIIQPADQSVAASILYAESASDPEGWIPKLNTYYKGKRAQEPLISNMKRVSSAYQKRSPQYRKAISGQLNSYEKKVFARILKSVCSFCPDPRWRYVHHENLNLYQDKCAAISHLRRCWGDCVDFKNCVQIGKEHYFARINK